MKKIFMVIAAAFALFSCEQFEDIKDVEKIGELSFGLQISLDKAEGVPAPSSYRLNSITMRRI